MRLWTLHPRYLAAVHAEAMTRGYDFDRRKIGPVRPLARIAVTRGQIDYEWRHLMRKLAVRDTAHYRQWRGTRIMQCHPLFRRVRGPVAAWERT